MIIVSAATGEFGRLVTDRLLDRVPAAEVAVAVRDARKADDLAARGVDVRVGDYDRPASLRFAFEGADRLLFISSPEVDSTRRMTQHRSVIRAARDAGVGTLAYTGALGADVSDEGGLADHHATERILIESGVPYIVLRHPIYSDFFINPGLRAVIESGELTSSTGGRGLNTATRADLAEAAAAVLTTTDHAGTGYNFTGHLWTYRQLAAVLTELGGRAVEYREVDGDEGIMAMIGPFVRSGAFERQTEDLERVLGRPAGTLEDAVAAALEPATAGRHS